MTFMLGVNREVGYSKGERLAFTQISDGKAHSTLEITKRYYNGKKVPYNGRKIVLGMLKSLADKVAHNKEKFRVSHSKRNGPNAIDFWLEKKS